MRINLSNHLHIKGRMLLLFAVSFLCYTGNVNALDINVSDANDIQDAINQVAAAGGGTVQLAAGTYIIDSSIKMKSNVTLQGVGIATRIELPLDATYPMIVDDGTEPCNNMTIRNMLLDGNIPESKVSHDPDYTTDPQNPCLGILIDAFKEETYHTNVIIENVEIHNTVDGCHLKGVRGGYMDNVYMHHNGIFFWPGHNAYLRRCIDYTVKNSRFEDSYNGSGVNCSWSKNLLFSNCQVIGSQGRGIRNAASEGFVVHDCIIIDCGDAGIIANAEQGITTSNCDFRRNCVSGCKTGITGGSSGVAYDNNVFNNINNYSLGSSIVQSGNTSNSSQSCSERLGEWNPISVSALVTNENPKQVVLKVSQNIAENNSYQGFTVKVDGEPVTIESITLLNPAQLAISLTDDITEEKLLTLSYSESGNVQTEYGTALNGFEDIRVINSLGSSFEIETASVQTGGTFVNLKLNKQIGTIHNQADNFTFKINDKTITTVRTVVGDSVIQVYPFNKIYNGDVVKVSYQPGDYARVIATNNSELEALIDMSVENLSTLVLPVIPGKIEAEDYDRQYGIQLEACGEGGKNIAYLNTDDWAEYNVLVSTDTTYKATFRVATKYGGGKITVIVDGSTKAIIEIPNTGDWQTYTSVSADMKLTSGANKIKLLFTEQFNVNWMQFEETEPGNEGVFYDRIEAENYNDKSGGSIETCSDTDGGEDMGSLRNGNWLMFSNLELSNVGGINMRLANTKTGSTVEVRLGSATGTLIGTVTIPNTGAWQDWETATADLESVDGAHDVYLVFKTSGSWVGNINWFQFSSTTTSAKQIEGVINEETITLYPNPVKDYLTIEGDINSKVEIYNMLGKKVLDDVLQSDKHTIKMQGLDKGIYMVKVQNGGSTKTCKLIKQ